MAARLRPLTLGLRRISKSSFAALLILSEVGRRDRSF